MTLQAGTRLGSHEIVGALGAGGMGEVYRARDSRLQREVAIKVLPESLSVDADVLARFGREAQVLAQLNHPNIAAVYGFEEVEGVRALVMELVEGQTLAEVIDGAAGQGLPVPDVVQIARQIASAMEAAHEQGIIHRDLKPANVKLRPDGTVKVLDFGLAKAFDPISTGSSAVFNSPTLSLRATQAGLVLGTAAYMSPEQAKGKPVDRRADIWAFGVVVFEILCGRSMYTGETVSEILARVIEREPDLSTLPAATPHRLKDLLRRCLVKEPRNRLRDIGEARVVLEEIAATPGRVADALAARAHPQSVMPVWRRTLPWALVAASAALTAIVAWAPWRESPAAARPIHLDADLGVPGQLPNWAPLALSPDGSTLAAVMGTGPTSEQGLIHIRRLDQTHTTALPGTAGGRGPFFSPDGQWIAFFADRKLKKISVNGGAAMTLADAPLDRGGSWGDDDTIVFAANNRAGLMRVSASGGTAVPFSELDPSRGEVTHRFPHILPGARAVLYMTHTAGTNFEGADIVVQRVSDRTRRVIRRGGVTPFYFHSGHLGFVQSGTLFLEPFDLETLTVTGPAFPLLEQVQTQNISGFTVFAASPMGTIAYKRSKGGAEVKLQWADPAGRLQPVRQAALSADVVAIAPDGQRVAIEIARGSDLDVWIYEPARDVLTPLTGGGTEHGAPVWMPDSSRIAYSVRGAKDGKYAIDWRRADSGGEASRLLEAPNRVTPGSWHPDGRRLAYVEMEGAAGGNIKILPVEGSEAAGWKSGTPTTFVGTAFQEQEPVFSPDGKWLAYLSNHSGRFEVYVRPYPGPGAQVQVSTSGAWIARWSPTAKELVFANLEDVPMVVAYTVAAGTFRPEKPRVWANIRMSGNPTRPFDLHPDGKRLMFLQDAEVPDRGPERVSFLFNAFEEIRRKAPARQVP